MKDQNVIYVLRLQIPWYINMQYHTLIGRTNSIFITVKHLILDAP